MLLDVVTVEARPDYSLVLELENGERRSVDLWPLHERRPFNRLKHVAVFRLASVKRGTVVWPGTSMSPPDTL